ncbi:hypothetical protein Drose_06530 [Dactylosporangium roseum]|uniref:Secreted protein n=1 Tax=Dactylosporangium roseum TaxID=47989 RepID=A0ABY5Z796_9ACTN|nr:hypothetical protein [Dactylosporangium roseum]UWZ37929.1 hypothetical protein Drose_06530 [Dactylosporangium roseum]
MKRRSYLLGVGVGAAVTGVLVASPFVPWQVAVSAGLVVTAVSVPFFRSLLSPAPGAEIDEDGMWADDGSGEREGWSGWHTRALSPHSAWAHGDARLDEPAVQVSDEAPQPAEPAQVVYDLDWLTLPGGRHRAPQAGAR